MPIRHLKNYKVMPWKNGGGSTTELAIHPADADLDKPFIWRLSLAQLDGSGPFSAFPGYDRIIMQLSGQPMRLLHPETSQKLSLFQPYYFKGELSTSAELSGKAQDFNLILRRGTAQGELECLQGRFSLFRQLPDLVFAYVWEGAARIMAAGRNWALAQGESLLIEEKGNLDIKGEGSLVLASIVYGAAS